MQSEFDKIWCLDYDEDSYYHSLARVNFTKHLTNILSNHHFPQFQKQIVKELSDMREWNQRSWQIIQFFQFLNDAFELSKFEQNVTFVSTSNMRKIFGSFRLWIDLERLYLFSFLKLDKIQFQEDRIFFSIFRTFCFFRDFFFESHIDFFNANYLIEIRDEVIKRMQKLKHATPSYLHQYLEEISSIIPNFMNRKILVDRKIGQQIKKMAYQKLSTEYQIINEIEQRLVNSINYKKKQGDFQKLQMITKSQQLRSHGEQVRPVYDPKFRIYKNFKDKAEKANSEIDEQLLMEHIEAYNKKMKEKQTSETPYQGISKVGHNPYDNSNYLLYGQFLGIDLDKKNQIQKQDEIIQVQECDQLQQYCYPPEYIQKSKQKNNFSGKVTRSDLKFDIIKKNDKGYIAKDDNKFLNTQWEKFQNTSEEDKPKAINMAALSTIQTANASKDLQKNTLFKKAAEVEEEEKEKRDRLLKISTHRGIQSEVLFQTELKAQQVYKIQTTFNNEPIFNIKHKCLLDRNKFDSIRKVIQYSSVLSKIEKWIKKKEIPDFYPRSIDEIREYSFDPELTAHKRQLALERTLDEE